MHPELFQRVRDNPAVFQETLIVPSCRGPQRFGDIMADFQRERFASINPALLAVAKGETPPIGRHFWEATKGASKDSDLAVCLLWLLAFTRRPLTCQVGAADADQADELRKAGKAILRLNGWLSEAVTIQAWQIVSARTESTCAIIPADVTGSHGARPDVLVLNELSHVSKREFAENLLDNAAKVPNGLAVIATNAGHLDTWQWEWRELARSSDRWSFHRRSEPAPWLNPAEIDEARRRNPPARFSRLWAGQWVAAAGDGIPPHVLDRAIVQEAIPWNLPPGVTAIVGAIDIGLKRDATGLAICGVDQHTRRVVTLHTQSWHPAPGQEVSLSAIESAVYHLAGQFRCREWVFDSWQAAGLRQRVANMGLDARDIAPTAANLDAIAQTVFHGFQEGCFQIPAGMFELIADLRKLSIIERPGVGNTAFRLVAPRDSTGHADIASAWCMAATQAQIYSRSIGRSQPVTAGNYFDDYPSVNGIPPCGKPLPMGYPTDLAAQGYNPATAHRISLSQLPTKPFYQ